MPTLPQFETAIRGKLLHKEIRRLHCEIYEIMRRLPEAKRRWVVDGVSDPAHVTYRDVPGDELTCGPPLLDIVTTNPRTVSGVSHFLRWCVRLRIGPGASWAQIVELIIHELAHCLTPGMPGAIERERAESLLPEPQRRGHSPEFWEMVVAAHRACYDVSTIPVMAGDRRYACDDRLIEQLYKRHTWSKVRVNLTGSIVAEIQQQIEIRRMRARANDLRAAKDACRDIEEAAGIPVDIDELLA